jgi:hypothetical protein
LQGATLDSAQLQGASLRGAQLQGASLEESQLQGASLRGARTWRARGTPHLGALTELQNINAEPITVLKETFAEWRDPIVTNIPAGPRRDFFIHRLPRIDPSTEEEPKGALDSNFWTMARSSQPQGEDFERARAAFLAHLPCSSDSGAYVARGLLRNILASGPFKHFLDAGAARQLFADRLRKLKSDPIACPGVKGLTDEDWVNVSKLSASTVEPSR